MTSNNSNWITEFEKEIKDENDEFNKLKDLKFKEKTYNDRIKLQTKEIKEKNAEKMRLKLESEERVRKEKDKVNKLRSKYAMMKQAADTEYKSILDTFKKNNDKNIAKIDEELQALDRQESMYKTTEDYMKKQVQKYKDAEGSQRKQKFEEEKKATAAKITELENKVRQLNEETENAFKEKEK